MSQHDNPSEDQLARIRAGTSPFDPAEFLGTPEAQAALISDALASGDSAYIADAIGIVARARGMTQVAKDAGVSRESLYRALSREGDPRLSTLVAVAKALGLRLSAATT
jgi:probable addiction module antidote protein